MADNDFSLDDLAKLGYGNHTQFLAQADPYATAITSSHITNNAYGINHRQTPLPIPMNKDHYGLTFFTRPQLNLQGANLRQKRIMHPLLTTINRSWQRFIRCTLDPRLAAGYTGGDGVALEKGSGGKPVDCDFVDPEMAFIPILTNNLITISGWKDIVVPTFTSKSGQYREEFSMADGITVDYTAYDLTATWRNLRGDPITNMFYYWSHYQSLVYEGSLVPYPDFIVNNELDYCTRIYRLVLDPSKTKVQRIAACGAAFPTAVPMAGNFDFSRDKPYNDVNAEISVPFRAMGFICQDDILIKAFNQTVAIFNPSMAPDQSTSSGSDYDPYGKPSSKMTQVPQALLTIFNNRGYPRIDPETYELQWYVKTEDYAAKLAAFNDFDSYLEDAFQMSVKDDTEEQKANPGINYID